MINTSLNILEDYDGKSLVLFIGEPAAEPRQAPAIRLDLDLQGADVFSRLASLPVEAFRHGVHCVIGPGVFERSPRQVRDVQKYVFSIYWKYFVYPRQAREIPDPYNVRTDQADEDILCSLRRAENTRLHLFSPLASRLEGVGRGLTALLLLPGPGLAAIGPHLAALKERCLIVTISRVLGFCHDHGVAPDFLVQLDTLSTQNLYFPEHLELGETTLVSLSIAPVRHVAHRFQQCFFMESFDTAILRDSYRMRESWLSSLIPCLGLTETLGCMHVCLAGADLSSEPGGRRYFSDAGAPPGGGASISMKEPHLRAQTDTPFLMQDRQGRIVETKPSYFATAGEAEQIMRQLDKSRGTTFSVFENTGILSPAVATGVDAEELRSLPLLERKPLGVELKKAMHPRPEVDLLRMKLSLLRTQDACGQLERLLGALLFHGGDEVKKVPFVRHLCREMKSGRFPDVPESEYGRVALELVRHWRRCLRQGLAWTMLLTALHKGLPVPLLLCPGESEEYPKRVADIVPNLKLRVLVLCAMDKRKARDEAVLFKDVLRELGEKPLFLVSEEARASLRRALPWRSLPQTIGLEDMRAAFT